VVRTDERDAGVGILVDREPHVDEVAMRLMAHRVHSRSIEHDLQDPRVGMLERETRERVVRIGHQSKMITLRAPVPA
jgi:hypothetical protein